MMFLTARVDLKKILTVAGIIAALILGAIWLLEDKDAATTGGADLSTNDDRVRFLQDFGWQVASSPVESSQVKIPKEITEVFDRYNTLQKSQGYDLTRFSGKHVMRYVYRVDNYPGATQPVYATLLVHKNQVIGGDITDTAADGKVQGFKMPAGTAQTTPTQENTLP